jgi:hypothetical protein
MKPGSGYITVNGEVTDNQVRYDRTNTYDEPWDIAGSKCQTLLHHFPGMKP